MVMDLNTMEEYPLEVALEEGNDVTGAQARDFSECAAARVPTLRRRRRCGGVRRGAETGPRPPTVPRGPPLTPPPLQTAT